MGAIQSSRLSAARQLAGNPLVVRLFMATLMVNVLMAAFAPATLYTSYARIERRAVVSTQNFAQVISQDLSAAFARMDLAIIAVKEEIEARYPSGHPDPLWMNAYIARQSARQPDMGALRVADAEGRIVLGTDVTDQGHPNLSFRNFFQELRASPRSGLLISKPAIGQISGKWSIVLARRIDTSDGSFAGIAFAVVFLERFKTAFSAIDLGAHGVVSLRDLDLGTVVRHPEPGPSGTAIGSRMFSKEWPEKLKENAESGSYFAAGLDGLTRALSYRKVAAFPFYVIVGQYPGDYLSEWHEQALYTGLLVLVFALVTCWLAWLVARAWKKRELEARLREADRERMLLELHDGCIQSIFGIGLQLEAGRQHILAAPSKAMTTVAESVANLNLVIQDLRAFIAGERAQAMSESQFMNEIERMLPVRDASGPEFSVDVDRSLIGHLKPHQALHLLRIARESVSNIVRHSGASKAHLSLHQRGRAVQLEVGDDGIGFAETQRSEGLGLHHISARARKLGGSARLHSVPAEGTLITVEFPLVA